MLSVRRDNVNVSNGDTQLSVLKKIGPVRSTKESNHLRKLNAGFKTGIKGKATRRVLTDISNSNFRKVQTVQTKKNRRVIEKDSIYHDSEEEEEEGTNVKPSVKRSTRFSNRGTRVRQVDSQDGSQSIAKKVLLTERAEARDSDNSEEAVETTTRRRNYQDEERVFFEYMDKEMQQKQEEILANREDLVLMAREEILSSDGQDDSFSLDLSCSFHDEDYFADIAELNCIDDLGDTDLDFLALDLSD